MALNESGKSAGRRFFSPMQIPPIFSASFWLGRLFFFILLLSVVPSFLNAKTLTKTNSMPLAQFEELSVVGNKNTSVMFVQNEQYTIEVKGCALNAMRIEQNDTSLFVSTMGLDTIQPIEIIVSAPSFPKVCCHFIKMLSNADTLHMPNILLSAYYSNIEMCVNADYFYLNFVSGTSAKLSGVCKEMNLKCDGYANGKNYTFDAQKLYIQNLQSACHFRKLCQPPRQSEIPYRTLQVL